MTPYERRMLVFEWVLGIELAFIFLFGLYGARLVGEAVQARFQPVALPLVIVAVCGMMLARLGRKNAEEIRKEAA